MFYKQFSKITDLIGEEIIARFDYWLTTLPRLDQKNISASTVASKLGIHFSVADRLLKYAESEGILEKYYMLRCPECDDILRSLEKDELADTIMNGEYCEACDKTQKITVNDIYSVYRVVKKPDVSDEDIAKAIDERLMKGDKTQVNFQIADSLGNDKKTIYEIFYSPNESAYRYLLGLREKIDWDYGKNTTAKGSALETLIKCVLQEIKYVKCSTSIKTGVNLIQSGLNQLDVTSLCGYSNPLNVFQYLSPYFITECKNEKKTPGNPYVNKLTSIMETNEAQLGIIWTRKKAATTCFNLAREHYLTHKNSQKQKIIITMCDDDLSMILDKRVNLLEYLEFKIDQVTLGSFDSTYSEFIKR